MAGDTSLTVVGNLTAAPDLRFTPAGDAVANFTVASTPRTFDRRAGEFKDGETMFMRCSAWRDMAENVANTLDRGMRVIVTGRLVSRSFETKEGDKRTVLEMQVDDVGPSLRYASAAVTKNERRDGNAYAGGYSPQQGPGGPNGGQPDPWAASNPNTAQGGGQQGQLAGQWPSNPPQGQGPQYASDRQPEQPGPWNGGYSDDEPPF